tara:strand:- start:2224 stop:2871 length:648 start_codon:yes stop_codon:yes gene_type:complete
MQQLNPLSLNSTDLSKEPFISKKSKESFSNKTIKNRRVGFSNQSINLDEKPSTGREKLKSMNELFSNDIHDTNEDDDEDNENNFKTNYNKMMSVENENTNSDTINLELNKMNSNMDNKLLNGVINSKYANFNDSYKSNLSYLNNLNEKDNYNNSSRMTYDNNELVSKLDYIIHLLEEQHNEKTNHITEELILYLFLGIFIIYVLDSFARASKYIR